MMVCQREHEQPQRGWKKGRPGDWADLTAIYVLVVQWCTVRWCWIKIGLQRLPVVSEHSSTLQSLHNRNTRICKAKWAEPLKPLPTPPPPPPSSLSLSLSLHKLEILNWQGLDLLQRAVRFLKKVYIGQCMQLTRTLYVLCAGVCHDTGPWPFVLWTLLSCVRINGCVPALILKHSRSFYYFRGCVCTDFRVYSSVGVVGVQLTKYSLDVMREYGKLQTWRALQLIARLCETSMPWPDVNACPWHRRCFCQIELVKRSCWSFPPPEIASLPPFSSCPKTVFPRFPLVSKPLTYPSLGMST